MPGVALGSWCGAGNFAVESVATLCGTGGNFAVESVAVFTRNQWQLSDGIGGNFRVEYAFVRFERHQVRIGVL
jgi:hypothetical protein